MYHVGLFKKHMERIKLKAKYHKQIIISFKIRANRSNNNICLI